MIIAFICMGILGLIFGVTLAYSAQKFAVKIDVLAEKIIEVLPGVNCGACGYPGCSGYAIALSKGTAEPAKCIPGGQTTLIEVCNILGVEVKIKDPQIAFIACQSAMTATRTAKYVGQQSCTLAATIQLGETNCKFACLCLGDCYRACPFNAIDWKPGTIPKINYEKCLSCKKCVKSCPKNLIALQDKHKKIAVACNSQDKGAIARKNCETACIACQKCVKICGSAAITVTNNVAKIDAKKCTLCLKCIAECPTKAIVELVP